MTAPGPSAPRAQAPAGAAYRPELQGLRALAVTLVVVYHVWIDRVSGGVDVFFLLTGFLLTGGLVRAAERGALDVRLQWSRTLRRLIPAASVVLVKPAGTGTPICVISARPAPLPPSSSLPVPERSSKSWT